MNKQEAIEKIEKRKSALNGWEELTRNRAFNEALDIVRKIDETEKPVVPRCVAEWIEECKRSGWHLEKALYRLGDDDKVGDWAYDENNDLISEKVDTFARAWLDGYEVEKEPLYVVTDGNKLYLKEFDELNAVIVIDDAVWATDYAKRYSDKTEAQKAADELGWVVKEVE